MISEVQDQYQLLQAVHSTVDRMIQDLDDVAWLKKPAANFNNIASVIEHMVLVEKKFFAVLGGETSDIDTQAPFKAESWDVAAIKADWSDSLQVAERALAKLTEADLTEFGLKLGVGEVNKRQLLSYTIAHTAHHRGQIPLIKKMLG